MKKTFILAISAILFFVSGRAIAQSFTVQHDTTNTNISGSTGTINILDGVAATSSPVTIKWKVVSTTFPTDWVAATGICDNALCYPSTTWTTGSTQTSDPYSTTVGDFHLQVNADDAVTTGCYNVRVKLWNSTAPNDSIIETYIVCKYPTSVPVVKSTEPVIYPNPATAELNVVYDATADVKNIAVYNLIGKVVSVYHVTGNSANLNLENVPAGIYFLRLMNSNGQVVATRKFTKQ
jgi:hypothetical protein